MRRARPLTQPIPRPVGLRGLILTAALFSVFTNLLMLTGPLFMLQVYDRVLASRSEETLVALFGLVAVLYLFYWLLEHARGWVMARAGARLQSTLDAPVFHAVLDSAALRRGAGPGGTRGPEAIRALFAAPVLLALFDMPWTPVFLAAIFIFHPALGWLAVAGGALLIVVAVLNQVLTARHAAEGARISAAADRFSRDAEAGAELVRAQGMVRAMVARWTALQDATMDKALRASDWSGSLGAFTKAFRLFLQSAMLALGAWLVLRGQITAGAMIAASILLGRALAPVEVAVSQWGMVLRARDAWRDIRALLSDHAPRTPPTELPDPAARLELRSVSVVPRQGDRPVLSKVSLALAPGEAIGVIGRSGSGKTTLARVLTGLVAPAAGEVRLAGATLGQYGAERLGRYIGYLPQDVRLFEGTVAENIARMELAPDPAKVVAAAKKARVHDIVLQLPDGYDTRIGAGEARLSSGQKQRLALARALYNDPVLLVLDEPNSALDAEGSEALNAAVSAMKADGRGVLIMTHRPMAISGCDKLLVLDGGRVAGFGPRDEIIRGMMRNAGDVQRAVNAWGTP